MQYDKIFDDDSILFLAIHPQSDSARGPVQFCHNLIANVFDKGNSPCTQEFTEIRIKRQTLDHYIKGICKIDSSYGIFLIEILPSQPSQTTHQIQTDKTVH